MIEAFNAGRQAFQRLVGRRPAETPASVEREALITPIPKLAEFLNGNGTFVTPTVQLRETGELDESGSPVLKKVIEVGYRTRKVPIYDESTGHTLEGVYREPFIVTEQEIQDARSWLDEFRANHFQIWKRMEAQGKTHELPSYTIISLRLGTLENLLETQPPQTVLFQT